MTKESKGVFTRPVYASPCLISGTFIGRIMKRSKHYRPEQLFIALPSRSVWHKRCAHWNNWPRTLVCRMDSRAGKPWCNSRKHTICKVNLNKAFKKLPSIEQRLVSELAVKFSQVQATIQLFNTVRRRLAG